MKLYLKHTILLSMVIFLASCASGSKYHEMVSTLPNLTSDTGRIFFYRIEPIPLLLKPSVMLNGEKVGNADPWGFFYVDRPAGAYEVSIPGVDQKVSLALESNQTRYIRLKLNQGILYDEIIPVIEEENEALKNIEYCNYSQGPGYCESECESAYNDCIDSAEGEAEWNKCENVKKSCDLKCSGSAS